MRQSVTSLAAATLLWTSAVYAEGSGKISGNEFNPAISLILDIRYSELSNEELALAGFQSGGEAGLPEPGFSLGHNELVMSANIDDKLYGFLSTAIVYEDGQTEIELEEAYVDTLGLGAGFTLRGGRFYSGFGYLNEIHNHAQDFTDRPLVYDAMVGGHLSDTGVQLRWTAPTDLFLQFGAEAGRGDSFPGGSNEKNNNGRTLFAKLGGDIGASHAWQAGLSYFGSEFDSREGGGHGHGDETGGSELLDGKTALSGVDIVYKWAPRGNATQRNLTLQFEYFLRDEEGIATFSEGDTIASANYRGDNQQGYYAQAVYQFVPRWRLGVRYDWLNSDNTFSDYNGDTTGTGDPIDFDEFAEESGFGSSEHDPARTSVMVDYSWSEYARLRLQYNRDETLPEVDHQYYLQFIGSLGAHGAHKF